MTCCDMCGKEIKSILDQRDVEIGNNIVVFARKRTMSILMTTPYM